MAPPALPAVQAVTEIRQEQISPAAEVQALREQTHLVLLAAREAPEQQRKQVRTEMEAVAAVLLPVLLQAARMEVATMAARGRAGPHTALQVRELILMEAVMLLQVATVKREVNPELAAAALAAQRT